MYRILLADDHPLILKRIYKLLIQEADIHAVEMAHGGARAITLSRQSHLDAVVLDISMPDVGGVVVLATLQQEQPRLPVLMLSTHANAYTIRHCLRLGALGYVAKESVVDSLMPALRLIIAGETYLCPVAQASLAAASHPSGLDQPYQ